MTNFHSTSWRNNSAKLVTNNETNPLFWDSLKEAIAVSSGFQRWQLERKINDERQQKNIPLDRQVSLYLRETLETLAY